MFKNILIIILAISTGMFAWLAIRNSTPLECSEILQVNNKDLCIVKMNGTTPDDLQKAIEQVKAEQYRYKNN